MKNKLFLLLAIIAVVGIAVAFNYSELWAEQQVPSEVEGGKYTLPVEFSTLGDRDRNGNRDAEQTLYTHVPDGPGGPYPKDGFDFDGVNDPSGNQVDALAHRQDVLFQELINNRVNLLVSFQGDTKDKSLWAVWMEDVAGLTSVKWSKKDLDKDSVALPDTVDLDALEVYGDTAWAELEDADYYSLQGDPNNTSVRSNDFGPYISKNIIYDACSTCTPGGYRGRYRAYRP